MLWQRLVHRNNGLIEVETEPHKEWDTWKMLTFRDFKIFWFSKTVSRLILYRLSLISAPLCVCAHANFHIININHYLNKENQKQKVNTKSNLRISDWSYCIVGFSFNSSSFAQTHQDSEERWNLFPRFSCSLTSSRK